ncbi:subtilisin-like protein [Rhizoclosmatium globosum]|uniref:Subtilisin-like protein n=1 Tax=Rhizoclosmatium globosum TaxID=329046 RepID=A0A1Y2AN28_9FUNG|nr:subtilisin-like protein [Rhizoclosmatium globosum]|eukprot:ORY23894.1 subtilisin-like protein [Rhizoclosmatium globosum]
MQLLSLLATLGAALGVAAQDDVFRAPRTGAPEGFDGIIPCTFFVEFPTSVVDPAAEVKNHFAKYPTAKYALRTSFSSDLISFASFELKGQCDEDIVASIGGAIHYQAVTVRAPPVPVKDVNPLKSGAPFVHKQDQIHDLTGVNKARNELGLTGKGVKVAVIDSGIYYLHPALGGGIGPNFKVVKGHDFVGNSFNGTAESIQESDDPLDNCSDVSHGTHVTGIIAGDARDIKDPKWAPKVPFSGVAPDARIYGYRVFGCQGLTGGDIITKAIYMAAKDGVDIINMSLGGGPAFNDESDSLAVDKVVAAQQIVVLASSGNSGSNGPFATGSPANAKTGISVASFDNGETYPHLGGIIEGSTYPASLSIAEKVHLQDGQTVELVAWNLTAAADPNNISDGCFKPSNDVTGKAAFMRWGAGVCGSVARCTNAYKAGAIACIIAKNKPVDNFGITGYEKIPGMLLPQEAGDHIVRLMQAGKTVNVTATYQVFAYGQSTGGTLSSFSSPGLDLELNLKPEIAGIGGNVLSTISPHSAEHEGSPEPYIDMSGTSMSSPYTAGVVALLIEKRGKIPAASFKAYLMNNAKPAPIYNTSLTHSPSYQGAGLVDAFGAATAQTIVTPPGLALNDTVNIKNQYTIKITNNYKVDVTYALQAKTAATSTQYLSGDDFPEDQSGTLLTNDQHATVTFLSNTCSEEDTTGTKTVLVRAGASVDVDIQFTPSALAPAGNLPVYGGYISITNSIDESALSVPYVGMIGSWAEKPFWSRNSTSLLKQWLRTLVKGAQTATTGLYADTSFAPLVANDAVNATDGSFVLAIPTYTSRQASVVVQYVGGDNAMVASGFSSNIAYIKLYDAVSGDDQGPAYWQTFQRTSYQKAQGLPANLLYLWTGRAYDFDSKSKLPSLRSQALPAGNFVMRFMGLKNFGDITKPADWDVLETVPFTLVY